MSKEETSQEKSETENISVEAKTEEEKPSRVKNETETTTEKSGFQEFVTGTIRPARKGIYQHLLCQHLISAVASRPLRKIRLICEASMMLGDPKSAGIDMEEIDVLHKVAMALIQTSHYKWGNTRYCYIPWPFEDSEENYERYVAVWRQNISLRYYPLIVGYVPIWQEDEIKRERERIEEAVDKKPLWQRTMYMTRKGNLTELSYSSLISQFTAWALPKIQAMFSKIAKMVDPSLYQQILETMTQQEGQAAKTKNAEEPAP